MDATDKVIPQLRRAWGDRSGALVRVLLVEDEILLGQFAAQALSRNGFVVDWEKSGVAALAALRRVDYDVLLLDLGLPDVAGDRMIGELRKARSTVPIIVLTARGQVGDRVAMLDLGADDYLVKPYDIAELQARMRALKRRTATLDSLSDTHAIGPLTLFQSSRTATWHGRSVHVTTMEFDLLENLVLSRPRFVSRSKLEQKLYGWGDEVESNAVEVHVHFLRRKFSARLIITQRGKGYRLATDEELLADAANPAAGGSTP